MKIDTPCRLSRRNLSPSQETRHDREKLQKCPVKLAKKIVVVQDVIGRPRSCGGDEGGEAGKEDISGGH